MDCFTETFKSFHMDEVLQYARDPLSEVSLKEIEKSVEKFYKNCKRSIEMSKIGTKEVIKNYFYSIGIRPQCFYSEYVEDNGNGCTPIVLDKVKVIYNDIDNHVIAITEYDNTVKIINLGLHDIISINKYEVVTTKTLIGYETATTEQLSNPDFEPIPIFDTVTCDPEVVEFNSFVSDNAGYRVLRDTRSRL